MPNPFARLAEQEQQAERQRRTIVAICAGIAIFALLWGIHDCIKRRDKDQREWQEKRDEEMKKALLQKPHENSSADASDKDKPDK
jgi:hypothetical protein